MSWGHYLRCGCTLRCRFAGPGYSEGEADDDAPYRLTTVVVCSGDKPVIWLTLRCRFADPGYYEGDPDDDDAPDPLTTALPNKAAYQHIRALPCPAGSACIFTHRCILVLQALLVTVLL
jgi:hypothetical protein